MPPCTDFNQAGRYFADGPGPYGDGLDLAFRNDGRARYCSLALRSNTLSTASVIAVTPVWIVGFGIDVLGNILARGAKRTNSRRDARRRRLESFRCPGAAMSLVGIAASLRIRRWVLEESFVERGHHTGRIFTPPRLAVTIH